MTTRPEHPEGAGIAFETILEAVLGLNELEWKLIVSIRALQDQSLKARQMAIAEGVMAEDHEVLKQLADN